MMTSTPMLSDEQIDAERVAFESWIGTKYPGVDLTRRGADGEYWSTSPDAFWEAWQARAILSAASVAAPREASECKKSPDGLHSETWQDGEECSYCGALAMSNAERVKQGMEPVRHEASCGYGDLPGQPCSCRVSRLAASPAAPVPPADLPDLYISGPYTVGKNAGRRSVCELATVRVVGYLADGVDVPDARQPERAVDAEAQLRLASGEDPSAMPPADGGKEPSDERILHLWDTHVGYETGYKGAHLSNKDKVAFARAVLAAAPASLPPAGRGEPVAWYDPVNRSPGQSVTFERKAHEKWPHLFPVALYATPPAGVQPWNVDDLMQLVFRYGAARCDVDRSNVAKNQRACAEAIEAIRSYIHRLTPSGSAGATEGNADGVKGVDRG